ncbi:hypothetical protein CCUS01_11380 [Colletotrichum cuscutae]|uniref:Uncharacterized protein n=1 Tax=Colletotrichum cuscutae TaxID=1209917 RepID=A0AAI9U371_9PEZI|nr:hypothetical protein CCUS01_11380 [Colletotrichum cuscutae]
MDSRESRGNVKVQDTCLTRPVFLPGLGSGQELLIPQHKSLKLSNDLVSPAPLKAFELQANLPRHIVPFQDQILKEHTSQAPNHALQTPSLNPLDPPPPSPHPR